MKKIMPYIKNRFAFFVSFIAFLCISVIKEGDIKRYIPGICLSVVLLGIVILCNKTKCSKLLEDILEYENRILNFVSLTSALGVICYLFMVNIDMLTNSSLLVKIVGQGIDKRLILVLWSIFICVSCIVALFSTFVIEKCLWKIVLNTVSRIYRNTYVVVPVFVTVVLSLAAMVIYLRTDIFYAAGSNDVLFSSDTYTITKANAWLSLFQSQNDIRQPLFMLAASPFMGVSYLVGMILSLVNPCSLYICYAIAQIILTVTTALLVSSLITSEDKLRTVYFLIICAAYPTIIFSLNLEQYVVATFWLVLFVDSCINETGKEEQLLQISAHGLITSCFGVFWYNFQTIKDWFFKACKSAAVFLACVLLFGRLDVFTGIISNINELTTYTGESLSFLDRLLQYATFVSNCFVGVSVGSKTLSNGYAGWGSIEITSISWLGIVIILLCIMSLILNYKDRVVKISASWIAVSFLLLCIAGYGSSSNALLLYSFYFGWAFYILILKLVSLLSKYKFKRIAMMVSVSALAVLLIFNFNSVYKLIVFAIENYPV